MQNRSTLFLFSIIGIIVIVASLYAFSGDKKTIPGSLPFLKESNQEIIEECLQVEVLDKTFQWDGKVMVSYTNICPNYSFKIGKTGLKYTKGDDTEYLTRKTPLFIGAASTETLELSIPFAIKPRVAYALADDAKAIAIK
ncbi:MAG: hypothetical protein ACRBG0_20090 [Lewinella sp.]|uniref:hypothetical protein n=1 Tax=Lewinella sp. TaxID=2004506 RepID=UPI003D6A2CAF